MKRREFAILASGVAAASTAWPWILSAQQKGMPVVGFLSGRSPGEAASLVGAFRQGLSEIGYVEGQNLTIEYRWAEGVYDRLPAMAADLVGRAVDVIVAVGGDFIALAAKTATPTIPIVFIGGADPVADGLVASLARPGGNVTGFSLLVVELVPKLFELLSELVPQAKVVAVLLNPQSPSAGRMTGDVEQAARKKGTRLQFLKASTESEIDAAFASLVQQRADALVVGADQFFDSRREQIVALSSRYGVPAIAQFREFAAAGGLISYGTNITAIYRQAGIYAGKILKGEKPADLPVQQPTTLELVINMKTAKALGLTIPPSLLGRANEVIE
jgi:putative tryptophan/tyrosine transport system substrate-binding protein